MEKSNKNKTLIYAIIFFAILLILDQFTKIIILNSNIYKTLIPDVLYIETVQNTGGAFGIGEGNTTTFIISNIFVIGIIIRFIYSKRDLMDKTTLYLLFAVIAGGCGNLIDRIVRGYVVDFIGIFPSINFPKFNLADMYITIGWIVLAFVFALYTYKEIKNLKRKKE